MRLQLNYTFFTDKRQRPSKNVHEIWQPVRMWRTVELSDVHNVVLVFEYSRLLLQKSKLIDPICSRGSYYPPSLIHEKLF